MVQNLHTNSAFFNNAIQEFLILDQLLLNQDAPKSFLRELGAFLEQKMAIFERIFTNEADINTFTEEYKLLNNNLLQIEYCK
jgi:hypothetical protein